ncbi:SpoIIE family protein phosphatase [Pseudobacillus wudalianchiensis]|uniref:Histidine kinase n=1 Tax=Pseudobacillus wudalianchiensis TaxID=1743143 RepID=A0A1B9AND1_9BACI|nr:SpoIIE family protein phosphatase [Bacillus wudalianchiensis]OCA85379.1 hypothetical protein A8F95_10555 [Bacillus wudalianchiensis]
MKLTKPLTASLSEASEFLADRLFQSIMEGVMVTNVEGKILFINPAFTEITGFDKEVIGLTPRVIRSGKHSEAFYKNIWDSIARHGQWKGEIWNKRKDGQFYVQWTTITVIKDEKGKPLFYASVFTDISAKKEAEQQLQEDLRLARKVQKELLSQPIRNQDIHITGAYLPSTMIGGDLYVWYQLNEHEYSLFVLDVMGHGITSALLAVSIRSLLRSVLYETVKPANVLEKMNSHVYSLFKSQQATLRTYFISGIYVHIDTDAKQIRYASAGHPPGLFIDYTGDVTELESSCPPLGMIEQIEVKEGQFDYEGRAVLVLYTDGLIEHGEQTVGAAIEELKKMVRQHRHLESEQIICQLLKEKKYSRNPNTFEDDITIVTAILY